MKFRIGNITLGGNSNYKLEAPIEGLASPEIRTADGNYSGMDGGYISSQLYGMRTIVLKGFFIGSCSQVENLRRELFTQLNIRYLYPIFITTFSGSHYFTEGYVTDIKSDIIGRKVGEYQITLLCPDPIIYDGGDGLTTDSAWVEGTFYKDEPGGFILPENVPVQWESGDRGVVVTNLGTIETYPTLILRGTFNNPTIENLTTGNFISLNRSTSSGDEIIIDMKQRIITLNGISIASNRDINSTWWALRPGNNEIVLTTANSDDTNYGVIKYRQGFQSI